MENTLEVNDQEIMIKEYKGQRVVTHWNIAKVHGTTTTHIRNSFDRTKKHMIKNVDYFLVAKDSEFVHTNCMNKEVSKKALNASKDIPLFTESGYLMITKSLTDDKSWAVQRTLVNCYFKVKEQIQPIEDEEEIPIYTNNLEGILNDLFSFDGAIDKIFKK